MAVPGRIIRPPSGTLTYPGTKPGFNASHLAASGTLISGVASAGSFANLVPNGTAAVGTVNGGVNAPVHKIDGKIGPANYAANNGNVSFAYPSVAWPAETTALIYVPDAATSASPRQLVNMSAAGNVGMFPFVDTTGAVTLSYANTNLLVMSPIVAPGVPYFIAVSVVPNSVYAGVMRRLDTGQVYAFSGTHAVGTVSGDTTLYVGNRGVNSRQSLGSIAAFMHAASFKNVQQLVQWSARPWEFWYPR